MSALARLQATWLKSAEAREWLEKNQAVLVEIPIAFYRSRDQVE